MCLPKPIIFARARAHVCTPHRVCEPSVAVGYQWSASRATGGQHPVLICSLFAFQRGFSPRPTHRRVGRAGWDERRVQTGSNWTPCGRVRAYRASKRDAVWTRLRLSSRVAPHVRAFLPRFWTRFTCGVRGPVTRCCPLRRVVLFRRRPQVVVVAYFANSRYSGFPYRVFPVFVT